ncbi:oligoribonuclease [Corynebacterium pseudotuberculosis]|uniref:Oligoribonuclease n=1 Tax=Corynebacterium pseudotuberculosis (strain C231) TaxID=681645 RepID=D9QC22_CORP2|nr:oligoribonuclease [Corynebacterium pseudotuberculosis]ADK29430.1 oligoribonuclease [Corynebacterium pseudotuberculosis FRC41]ADL11098.1 oligoribonuclease [Corynebacterium pseudotuberculosis C231]ADL21503.1 oligoribonuclease [Corynebacterium pseudotuberculosis 1002]ADO26899.1 oligoribonuclease [Corynebacterium pseudotuberculosis I19]AEK92961.1 Oligoribonuclease [Corynebacterium pseudotuberculosis PAT10]
MTQDKSTLENMSDTPAKNDRLVWIDLEMTGLDTHRHVIVEVAALITDADLNILGEGVDLVVHATDAQLAEMDDYVTAMHENSGLTQEIRSSTVSIEEAEDAVLELIAKHCDPQHPAPLAGNSIATDRSFINAYMPRLDNALHYRMVDVSSVKELARRWAPRVYFNQPQKGMAHRALADIIESIRELAYYRRALFKEDLTTSECNDASTQATQSYQQFLQ